MFLTIAPPYNILPVAPRIPPAPDHNVSGARLPQEAAETAAVMKWSLEHRFVAGVSMHEGAVVANYPWDGSLVGLAGCCIAVLHIGCGHRSVCRASQDRKTHYSSCPDDEAYKHLATVYANSNPQMKASREFPGGITNGAGWYPLFGGMQDWNYLMAGSWTFSPSRSGPGTAVSAIQHRLVGHWKPSGGTQSASGCRPSKKSPDRRRWAPTFQPVSTL